MSRVYPPPAITVDLTTQQKILLADHLGAVPSQGAIFGQVWPTHFRCGVFDHEEARKIERCLTEILEARKARLASASSDIGER